MSEHLPGATVDMAGRLASFVDSELKKRFETVSVNDADARLCCVAIEEEREMTKQAQKVHCLGLLALATTLGVGPLHPEKRRSAAPSVTS